MNEEFSIIEYNNTHRDDLLHLLSSLHGTYFTNYAPERIRELGSEKNVRHSYEKYIDEISSINDGSIKILLAAIGEKIAGAIIGSIHHDDDLVAGNIGMLEDWYVEAGERGKGMGRALYAKLEQWFTEQGCQQVRSDTWQGNDPSIKAHLGAGFFISGVQFSKKL